MDIKNQPFKELAKEFNNALSGLTASPTSETRYLKRKMFDELKKAFPGLKIEAVDVNYNQFRVIVEYTHGYGPISTYDDGSVRLIFKIRTKKTEQLEVISKTRSKYKHCLHDKPVTFGYFDIWSYTPSYDWHNEDDINDLRITSEKWRSSNREAKNVEGKSLSELLENVKATYENEFRLGIVQPYLKQVFMHGKRRNVIYNALPKTLQQAIDAKDSPATFDGMADYIIDQDLLISS